MPAPEAPLPTPDRLWDDAACGLLLTSADGGIRLVNRTFCGWIGHEPQALVGQRRIQDLLTMGGRIFHQTHWAPLLQMQGSIAEVKVDLMHRDGHTIPMMMNAVRRDHPEGLFNELSLFVAEDRHQYEQELLRARRRAEDLLLTQQQAQQALVLAQARLRLALDSARLFVWDVDPVSGGRRYEPGVSRLLGAIEPDAISDARFAASIDPEDREREAKAFALALEPASTGYACIYRIHGLDGVRRTVSSSGRGFFDADGKLLQFVGVLQDISEQTRQRAEAEDRALFAEQMIGIVSHDLRNPLSAIQASSHLLGRGELTANQRRVLGRIASATDRAQRLISDLLDFTMARVGRGLAVSTRSIDLHGLVGDCVEELALAFPGRALEHRQFGEGDCPVDADRLVQLIGNLVANAMSYGAADRPVTVTSRIEPASASVAVHNEGTPVPDEILSSMFEAMIRGSSVANPGRGVGLGLYIVREIARAHGGGVEVASSAAQGTTFTAHLPRAGR